MTKENEQKWIEYNEDSNFQLFAESNQWLLCFSFASSSSSKFHSPTWTSLCDWSRKVTPPSQLFTCKTKTIATWSSAFSRALGSLVGFILRYHWLLMVFRFFWVAYVDVIILGLVLQHSIEKCTNQSKLKTPKVKLKHAKRLPRGMELWKYANLDRLKVLQI